MRRLGVTLAGVTLAVSGVLWPIATASASATTSGADLSVNSSGRDGPFGSYSSCIRNRSNFTRYYHVSDCYEWYPTCPDGCGGGWWFDYWD